MALGYWRWEMSRNRNKRLQKVRRYRDKLIEKITNLEALLRHQTIVNGEIKKALSNEDTLRAYALADGNGQNDTLTSLSTVNELASELALVYRMLNVERKFGAQILIAAGQRDYLRVAALAADHNMEAKAHDDMLSRWSRDHGFTRILREEAHDEDVT